MGRMKGQQLASPPHFRHRLLWRLRLGYAGGLNGGGRSHLHPEIPRTLSVRECARLQSFPDNYIFVGPTARQFTQVGNAVPPVLAARMGQAIMESYY